MFRYTQPSRLRIEASSACNLRCPAWSDDDRPHPPCDWHGPAGAR